MPNSPLKFENIAFVASEQAQAREALDRLAKRYGNAAPESADVIVALGGDGLMLETLHKHMNARIPIYGMHRGSVGFLMNEYDEEDLRERLAGAQVTRIHPLTMTAENAEGASFARLAINEVSLFRATHQAAKLRISVDGTQRMSELISDGILVATPAGSTAYNLSLQGPIIPIEAPLLALTPISPFRPRRWRGALLSNRARVAIDVLEPNKRPMNAAADNDEIRNVVRVEIEESRTHELLMLFDPGHSLDERIISEQFIN
ncbi:MAG: NAD kinase [Hyphomicrobiaceae bacterium]|nr:NAD kinase [Hyphomicrobiaceae bacterium]